MGSTPGLEEHDGGPSMIRVTIRTGLVVAACVFLLLHPGETVDLIRVATAAAQSQPTAWVSLLAAALLVTSVSWWAARMIVWRPQRTMHVPLSAITRMAPPRNAGNTGLMRTSRHEAAHAVAALKLGMNNISANIHTIGNRAGRVEFTTNENVPLHESLFDQLVFGISGQVADHAGGFFDNGSTSDLEMQQGRVFHLLSIGRPPERMQGLLSTDSLILSARAEASRLLEEHAELLDCIADMLLQKQQLDDAELRALAASVAALSPNCDVDAPTHREMTVR